MSADAVSYVVELTDPAEKALRKLDQTIRRRIGAAFDALETDPRPVGSIALAGQPGVLRIRVGDCRILYTVEDDHLVVR